MSRHSGKNTKIFYGGKACTGKPIFYMKRLIVVLVALLAVVGFWVATQTDGQSKSNDDKGLVIADPDPDTTPTEAITATPTETIKTTAKKSSTKKTTEPTPTQKAEKEKKEKEKKKKDNTPTSTPTPTEKAKKPDVTKKATPTPTEEPEPTEKAEKPDEIIKAPNPTPALSATPMPTPTPSQAPEEDLNPPITYAPAELEDSGIATDMESTTKADGSQDGDYFPDFSGSDASGDYYESLNHDPSTEGTDEPF